MIGRMRPFYQVHWDISKDIKHVWLLICTYYIAWIFQWILGDEGRGKWWDRQYRVWIPQCAAYPGCYCYICKRQFCGFTGWAFCLLEGGPRYPGCDCYICKRQFLWIHRLGLLSSRGGAQISWHQSYKSITYDLSVAAAHGPTSRYLHYSARLCSCVCVCVRSERHPPWNKYIHGLAEGLAITVTESKMKLSLILSVSVEEWRGGLYENCFCDIETIVCPTCMLSYIAIQIKTAVDSFVVSRSQTFKLMAEGLKCMAACQTTNHS